MEIMPQITISNDYVNWLLRLRPEKRQILEALQKIRNEKGIHKNEMAEKLGVERQTYYTFENGKRSLSFDILLQIADILEVSVWDFFPKQSNEDIRKETLKEVRDLVQGKLNELDSHDTNA